MPSKNPLNLLRVELKGPCAAIVDCERRIRCTLGGGEESPEIAVSTNKENENRSIEIECHSYGKISSVQTHIQNLELAIANMEREKNGRNLSPRPEDNSGMQVREESNKGSETTRLRINHGIVPMESSKGLPHDSQGHNERVGMEKKEETPKTTTDIEIKIPFVPYLPWPEFPNHAFKPRDRVKYIQEYKSTYNPTVCIDFDGVIHKHQFVSDFSTWFELFDPMPGAKESLDELIKAGWYVIIFTNRQFDGPLSDWLVKHNIKFHDLNGLRPPKTREWAHNPEFTSGKPIADVYIDDRSIEFMFEHLYNPAGDYPWGLTMEKLRAVFPQMRWTRT